jgi:hypothetical protein
MPAQRPANFASAYSLAMLRLLRMMAMQSSRPTHRQTNAERVQPGEDRAEPHALANELTEEASLKSRAGEVPNTDPALRSPGERRMPSPKSTRDRALTTTQKDVGRQMLLVIGGIIAAGLILAAVVTRQWFLLGLGALMIIPFMILVSAPFWLATTTKTAQDDKVREARGHNERENNPRNPPLA